MWLGLEGRRHGPRVRIGKRAQGGRGGSMRVLITGAAGYVGSILINALEPIDGVDKIVGVDLKPKPDRLVASTKITWIQADVSADDWQAVARDHGVEAVVHL